MDTICCRLRRCGGRSRPPTGVFKTPSLLHNVDKNIVKPYMVVCETGNPAHGPQQCSLLGEDMSQISCPLFLGRVSFVQMLGNGEKRKWDISLRCQVLTARNNGCRMPRKEADLHSSLSCARACVMLSALLTSAKHFLSSKNAIKSMCENCNFGS